jgi:CD2 antigen cytoplasmic tail-binding protein 2
MSYNSASSKRAAEDYARTTHGQEDFYGQPTKKPRFDLRNPSALAPDALEDDAVLEADVIGGRGQQVRRGAVNIDGYDSDSDNDNFDARADAKVKEQNAKSKAEEDNDMFADLEEDFNDGDESEADAGRRRKKKAVHFLNADQIVGQVENSTSGGHVSADFKLNSNKGKGKVSDNEVESSSDSEVDDETRANADEIDPELGAGSKKIHAPKLDAFNMKSELEEGGFDDQENYVRKAVDPDAKHDVWLEGMSKKEIKRAKEAAEKREVERRRRDLEDDSISTGTILSNLIPLLERGETTLEALARLGKRKDKRPKWQSKVKNKRNNVTTEDNSLAQDDAVEQARRQKVEAITGAADILMTRGQAEIYDIERELLVRQYRRETGEDWVEPAEQSDEAHANSMEQLWEYRWTDARDGGAINGPYDADTMRQWSDAGYFGEGVEFRRKDGGDWTRVAAFA